MFDIIILIIILASAIFAFFRGFSLELLSISGWIISFYVSYSYGNNLVNLSNKFINNIFISNILSYVVIFITVFVFFSFLTRKFSIYIKESYVGLIDKSMGFIFGLARGYVIIGLCFFAFDYFYQGKKLDFIDNSKIIPIIKITNNTLLSLLDIDSEYSRSLSEEIKKKSELLFEKSIDSKLKLKDNNKNNEEIYNESGRRNIENIIENNIE